MSDARRQFEQLFDDCYDAVNRYAARRVGAEAVQDVVADTFLVAWRRHDDLDGEPLPWLLGIARRVAANHLRAGARRDALRARLRSEPLPLSTEGTPLTTVSDAGLGEALAKLGECDREALMLVVWDELNHSDAARVMGCSTGAFAVRVHRARRRLARALADEQTNLIDVPREARSPL